MRQINRRELLKKVGLGTLALSAKQTLANPTNPKASLESQVDDTLKKGIFRGFTADETTLYLGQSEVYKGKKIGDEIEPFRDYAFAKVKRLEVNDETLYCISINRVSVDKENKLATGSTNYYVGDISQLQNNIREIEADLKDINIHEGYNTHSIGDILTPLIKGELKTWFYIIGSFKEPDTKVYRFEGYTLPTK